MILPFLLITLHFSQIGFTDDLTFTIKPSFQKSPFNIVTRGKIQCKKNFSAKDLFFSPDDTSFGQIVGRHFQSNFIPGINSNVILSELTADVSNNLVAVFKFNPELCSGKFLRNYTFDFDNI